ncbi:DUF732 domain-containing protein [Nocardia thailandica]
MTQPPYPPQYPAAPNGLHRPPPQPRSNTTLWVLLAAFGVIFLACGGCTAAALVASDDADGRRRTVQSTPPTGAHAAAPPGSPAPHTSAPRAATTTPKSASDSRIAEAAFFLALDSEGIYYSSRQAALDLASAVCEERRAGTSEVELATALAEKGYSIADAAYLVGAAESQFCPEYA